nr:invertebrate-type lysozyme 3 [Coridius chinensis]
MHFHSAILPAVAVLFVVTFGLEEEVVSESCMKRICEMASNCQENVGCDNDVCGPFKITMPFWIDAYRPTITGDNPKTKGAFERCTTDAKCAEKTVQSYMKRYARDCNGDDRVTCIDFAAIHRFGPFGCRSQMNAEFENSFNDCSHKSQPCF